MKIAISLFLLISVTYIILETLSLFITREIRSSVNTHSLEEDVNNSFTSQKQQLRGEKNEEDNTDNDDSGNIIST